MFIVFDTCVWIKELALNSSSGAAVRFFVQQHGATVVVPEVVRFELERKLFGQLCASAEEIRRQHRELLAIFGDLKEVVLPNEDEIREKVSSIVISLDVPTKDMPLSLDAARSSFLKTIDKVPPSDKRQEFKDGVIWANCVELLSEAEVYLVTADKAFYSERVYDKGLAMNLLSEVKACNHNLKIVQDLAGLLRDIRKDVKIDEKKLVDTFLPTRLDNVNRILDRVGFVIEEPPEVDVKLYATEKATRLYMEFMITYQCSDFTGKGRNHAILELRGSGSHDTATGEYFELRSHGEKLEYTDEEGQQKLENTVAIVGSAVLGHRTVQHTVRVPLS